MNAFTLERLLSYREAASGCNEYAYFLSKMILDVPIVLFFSLCFIAAWFPLISPLADWPNMFILICAVWYSQSGIGYLGSMVLESPFAVSGMSFFVYIPCPQSDSFLPDHNNCIPYRPSFFLCPLSLKNSFVPICRRE